ncbi:hypothetical protein BT96DRAFT_234700 [Gymnopus androsaceus JB14]|uniref:Uncharacterized protein n=1 Tax=Gymnopus androsaceus JB14 TaxID=1447944 RepID=A0A6A4IJN4_9AGAR|nr:hypothetical protein BT96DRAFT_234700 [Gymnopus androsaceus JB14]
MAASVSPTRKVHCYFINHSYIPLANPSTLYAIPSTHTFVQVEKLILADDRCAFLERDTQVDKEVLLFKPPPEMVTAFSRRAKYHFHEHKNDLQLIGRLETLSTVYTPEETVFIIILLPYAVPDPEQFFVGVTRQGPLREEDVYRNGIGEPEQVDERVLAFCAALAKPRKIPKEIYDRIDAEDDKSPIFNELLESADDLPNGTHGQTRLSWNYEADLYLSLSRYGKRDTMFDGAKGSVMNSKFFMPLAESLKARNVDTNRNFTCLFSGRSWPFGYRLICRLLDRLVSFTPRSDNSVWIGQLPMFISETYSEGGSGSVAAASAGCCTCQTVQC